MPFRVRLCAGKRRGGALVAAVLAVALAAGGCESEFEPFETSDAALSLFGYLDVAADTQWVRVSVLRRGVGADEPGGVAVTLEHLGTGERTALRDSVFRFDNGGVVHNFWTDRRVEPATAYRLTAVRPDGATAAARFETPPLFPEPDLESGLSPFSSPTFPPTAQSMRITGVEKLADLRIAFELTDPATTVVVGYLDRIQRSPDGAIYLGTNTYADVREALGGGANAPCPGLRRATVFLAAATDAWPDLTGLDAEELALPSTFSNVDGGLGYVGGVVTREGVFGALPTVFALHQAGCR